MRRVTALVGFGIVQRLSKKLRKTAWHADLIASSFRVSVDTIYVKQLDPEDEACEDDEFELGNHWCGAISCAD
jgi:hypothetical protein